MANRTGVLTLGLSRNDAEGLLRPYLNPVLNVINKGVAHWGDVNPSGRAMYKPRTQSNIINDAMCFHAIAELDGLEGVRWKVHRGQFMVVIRDLLFIRFKLLDRAHRARNIVTQNVLDFLRQIQPELPDMPDLATNLFAGYQWNSARTEIEGIFIVCPTAAENAWELRLDGGVPLVAVPSPAAGPAVTPPRIRPDIIAARGNQDGGS